MAGNVFGRIFQLVSFGESHGKSMGGVVNGCPANLNFDFKLVEKELLRRTPSLSFETKRKEIDLPVFHSGIYENKTLGTPIAFTLANSDFITEDYVHLKEFFRPSHADFTYFHKYGLYDYRGGGRASARETAVRVVGGAVAKMFLKNYNIEILAFVRQIGTVALPKQYFEYNLLGLKKDDLYCPDYEKAILMKNEILKAEKAGDTLGGVITCVIKGIPAGIGEPVFDKLQAELAKAMLSINAVKGFDYGEGFSSAFMSGSHHNDSFSYVDGKVKPKSNHAGGIIGGISTGEDIYFNVVFKPISSIRMPQDTVNKQGESKVLKIEGRHDVCVVPRAVVVVEAMSALVIADQLLLSKLSKI